MVTRSMHLIRQLQIYKAKIERSMGRNGKTLLWYWDMSAITDRSDAQKT